MKELIRMKNNFNLRPEQKAIFNSSRLPEELYDITADPDEIKNLAEKKEYKKILEEMRILLKNEMIKSFDTGLMPEPEMIRLSAYETPFNTGHNNQIFPVQEILKACDIALQDSVSDDVVIKYLKHSNGFVRYWTLISAEQKILSNRELKGVVEKMIEDDLFTVQIEAAKCLMFRKSLI
jgi:N-sulfoglucosamine sulfohydrolase